MPSDGTRERDLVLAPNEFAYISDQTKGNINVYVGPYKTSLANTDQPVTFNERSKRFERCSLEQSTTIFPTAPEGWYVVMKNPANDGGHPKTGTVNNLSELKIGRKVNVPGPCSFALWPGQMVKVVQGHHLRSNQYLLVRVYDEEAAKREWGKAVIKPVAAGEAAPPSPAAPELTLGKQLVIQGTRVSFYIPPTGVEVVRDSAGSYVREAVTLERLEYCMLKDESGNKRYIQGPAVVFPEPTETFVARHGTRKFKAIELNEISGIYVKVIAPYVEDGREHAIGDELFITGKDQSIYYPRPEHAVIKYGEQEVHHAVAIPAGEGRYVLDRVSGQVALVRGPRMLLPDPRREVIVRRVLDARQVELLYPGNKEALAYNQRLRELLEEEKGLSSAPKGGFVAAEALARKREAAAPAAKAMEAEEADESPLLELGGDDFQRKTSYTPPRTLTLDTKYEGAVAVSVWTGYAVLVVSKSGERRVITGPATHLLEYDQTLEAMELSTGTPKTDARLLRTVYVRTLHNKVSDRVSAETRDLCRVEVLLSYRVNFEGDPELWFNVENYVKFLTDHMRSLLANAIKRHGVEEFYGNAIAIVRDAVLGPAAEGGRRGREFAENGMRIYDVEVLEVKIGDEEIAELLVGAQHEVVNQTLHVQGERRRLDLVEQTEAVKREVQHTESKTRQLSLDLQAEEVRKKAALEQAELEARTELSARTLTAREAEQAACGRIHEAELARRRATSELEQSVAQRALEQRLAELEAEVRAVVSKAGAVSPDLVAALQAFSDRALVERVSESMAPLAIMGGKSVTDVLSQLLKGTALERALGNGGHTAGREAAITG